MYKKFFINLSIIFIPFIIIIPLVNYKVDSAFVINDRTLQVADIIASGKNAGIITVPSQWGSLQKAIVDNKLTQKRDIIVFGTSRSSEINSKIFPNNSFFNCALPGGNILDYIALYGLYKKNNLLPKYLIISIDPFSFHSRKSIIINGRINYLEDPSVPLQVNPKLINEFEYGLKDLNIRINNANINSKSVSTETKNFTEFFNPDYFQLNIKYFFGRTVIETNDLKKDNYFIIRSDGGYSLVQQDKIDSVKVKKRSYDFVNIHKSMKMNFFLSSDTKSEYWKYFIQFLERLKNDGVIPIVYISPVNPIVYDGLVVSSNIELENSLDVYCSANSILRIGSFNPHKYGYNYVGKFFIDQYHPAKSTVNHIFSSHKEDLQKIGLKIY